MKHLCIAICLLFAATSVSAQGLDLGVKAGVNFSNVTDASGFDNKTGFVVGGFVGGKFNDNVGMQADVLFSQQGAELDAGEFNLDYVNIPIVLKLYIAKGFHAQIGPQFGVLINDDTQTGAGEVVNDIATNNFDFSGVVGLGLDIPLGLRLEGRYNFGINSISDGPVFDESNNSVFTLSLGYSFL
tara:strand:- start:62195 stop:62749 length:555 start_codon:yes stop_codon:yes gene_type:complete